VQPWPTTGHDSARLHRWAKDTWTSLVAMTDEHTGLPADNIAASLAAADRSRNTSPTNIGGYLWSTVAARRSRSSAPVSASDGSDRR